MKLKTHLMNKKGIFGMDSVKPFIIGLFILGMMAFASLVAIDQLAAADPSAAGSAAANRTTNVLNNISTGTESLFSNAGTWMSLLAVVVLILIISVVIFAVNRFGGGSKGGL